MRSGGIRSCLTPVYVGTVLEFQKNREACHARNHGEACIVTLDLCALAKLGLKG